MADLEEMREFYARLMAAESRSSDPRYERIFALVPREAFLPPGPWTIMAPRPVETPSADPAFLYQNVLVALDRGKGINNGEPFLHAAWIGAVAPQPGEIVSHIGAGTGYYSAILSMLVLPAGKVNAFEVDPALAHQAAANLAPFENAEVFINDATAIELPASDIVYVNAAVAAPPPAWLDALQPGGRMIFPWRPTAAVALAMLVRREAKGFSCRPLMPAVFIACVGADAAPAGSRLPTPEAARTIRSLRLCAADAPDASAVAVIGPVWFSSAPPAG
jgi:protein-L-isoaspartate(D-aspartate) O-methyltransferase